MVSFIPCLFFYSRHFVSYGKLRFPESSPFGRRPFERIGFQPTRNTIACLQFDHVQRFESTTNRFALQLYGEFNWKYSQIGLLCSLWLIVLSAFEADLPTPITCKSGGFEKRIRKTWRLGPQTWRFLKYASNLKKKTDYLLLCCILFLFCGRP